MYHRIECIGCLGRDPEMRYTPGGTAVTNFSVATNQYRKNSEGEREDQVIWIRVTAWGNLAEICNEYLRKGHRAFISGELIPDENGNPKVWQRRDETWAASYEMTAREVKFLSTREEREQIEKEAEEAEPDIEEETPF